MTFEALPRSATVNRFIHSAAGAAAIQRIGRADHLPYRRKQSVGVFRIEDNVDSATLIVDVQNFLPSLAAIAGPENPPLGIGSVGVSQRGDESDVGIFGMDDHGSDVARVVQSNVLPVLAAIEALVNAVAIRNVAADAGF